MVGWLYRFYFGIDNSAISEQAELLTNFRLIEKPRTKQSLVTTYSRSSRRLVRGRRLRFGNQDALQARELPTAEVS